MISSVRNIYGKIRLAKNKQTFVSPMFNHVYKVAWSHGRSLLKNEFRCQDVLIGTIWEPFDVLYRPRVNCILPISVGASEKLTRMASNVEIEKAIESLVGGVSNNHKRIGWRESLDSVSIEVVMSKVDLHIKNFIESSLKGIELPVTGAHGDLIDRNFMLSRDGDVKIIDWEFYRPHGSIITDLLRNEMYRATQYGNDRLLDPRALYAINDLSNVFYKLIANHLSLCVPRKKLAILGAVSNASTGWSKNQIEGNAGKLSKLLNSWVNSQHS